MASKQSDELGPEAMKSNALTFDQTADAQTCILSADICGYSGLMCQDEQKTFKRTQALFARARTIIERLNGVVYQVVGDNLLAVFESSKDAVAASMLLQIREIGGDDEPLTLRVGIHRGQVHMEQNVMYGTTINIAARLQCAAPKAGTCISNEIYDELRGDQKFHFQPMGDLSLKNIPHAVNAYCYDQMV